MTIFISYIICYCVALLIAKWLSKIDNYSSSLLNTIFAPLIGGLIGTMSLLGLDFSFSANQGSFTNTGRILAITILFTTIPLFNLILPLIRLNNNYKNFNNYDKMLTNLSFNQFKNIYLIDPNKWCVNHDKCIYYDKYHDNKYFGFKTIIDFYKYLRFLKWIAKNNLAQKQSAIQKQKDKELAKVLTEWTDAIEEYRNENVYIPLEKIKHNVKMKEL